MPEKARFSQREGGEKKDKKSRDVDPKIPTNINFCPATHPPLLLSNPRRRANSIP